MAFATATGPAAVPEAVLMAISARDKGPPAGAAEGLPAPAGRPEVHDASSAGGPAVQPSRSHIHMDRAEPKASLALAKVCQALVWSYHCGILSSPVLQ
jgi:hypothetical protein